MVRFTDASKDAVGGNPIAFGQQKQIAADDLAAGDPGDGVRCAEPGRADWRGRGGHPAPARSYGSGRGKFP